MEARERTVFFGVLCKLRGWVDAAAAEEPHRRAIHDLVKRQDESSLLFHLCSCDFGAFETTRAFLRDFRDASVDAAPSLSRAQRAELPASLLAGPKREPVVNALARWAGHALFGAYNLDDSSGETLFEQIEARSADYIGDLFVRPDPEPAAAAAEAAKVGGPPPTWKAVAAAANYDADAVGYYGTDDGDASPDRPAELAQADAYAAVPAEAPAARPPARALGYRVRRGRSQRWASSMAKVESGTNLGTALATLKKKKKKKKAAAVDDDARCCVSSF